LTTNYGKLLTPMKVNTDANGHLEARLKKLPHTPGFSITVINDCGDPNEQMRIITRLQTLFERTPIDFCEVDSDLEVAGNLIDALDAKGGGAAPGVILPNVAIREPEVYGDSNGSPFCYFVHENVLVLPTSRGRTLSLAKSFLDIEYVNVLEPREVLQSIVETGDLEPKWIEHIAGSQFRSYEFQPLVAARLCGGYSVPHKKEKLACPNPGSVIWHVDKHGNCKSTVTTGSCSPEPRNGDEIATRFGTLRYYRRLTDAPLGVPAIITGSSGLGAGPTYRFLEIVIRKGRAADHFKIKVGDEIF